MSKKIISNLFNYAASENAKGFVIDSDPGKVSLSYYFHDGEERSFSLPKKLEESLILALRQVLKLSPDELISKKYCKLENSDNKLSFHLTIMPSKHGEKIIISIIPKTERALSLNQLGMSRENLKIVRKNLKKDNGLIIVSSPHGQGKNTTLAAMIAELECSKHSAYFLSNKTETEFNNVSNLKKNKNTWSKLLTLDSEIIITEISNQEDFKNAAIAAASGRLVLASITADSAWEVLLNYLKLNLSFKLKLEGLKLIVNQRIGALKRTENEKLNNRKNKRREIGLFEVLEISKNIKSFLIETEKDKTKNNFWEKLGAIAIEEGYQTISKDYDIKKKHGLLK